MWYTANLDMSTHLACACAIKTLALWNDGMCGTECGHVKSNYESGFRVSVKFPGNLVSHTLNQDRNHV
jgi:hypothetical protein